MRFTSQSKMSEVTDAVPPITDEERQELLETEFNPTLASLTMTLREMGMTPEGMQETLESAQALTEAGMEVIIRQEGDDDWDPTVAEMMPVTMMCDAIVLGILAHTLFMNKEVAMPHMESELMQSILQRWITEEQGDNQ